MGGLREERFWRDWEESGEREQGMGSGDGSETGSVAEEGKQAIKDQYQCQPHPGLQG